MKLIIKRAVQNQINYLLNRFKGTEWSGPAFYSNKKDKHGYPTTWILEGFVQFDLGGAASTEWDGEDFFKHQKEIYNTHPEFKKCYIGLIHSHHELTIGACFSGTDENQLEEAANKVGYPSLVVSTIPGKTHAFAVSYVDNFNQKHIIDDTEVIIDTPKIKANHEWIKWANRAKKASDKVVKITHNHNGWNYGGIKHNQQALWNQTNGVDTIDVNTQKKIDTLESQYDQCDAEIDALTVKFANGKVSNEQVEEVQERFKKIKDGLFKLTGFHYPQNGGGYYGF